MLGLMQDKPLLISSLLEHAERFHPEVEVVSKTVEGTIHRTNWREIGQRARRLAISLEKQGVKKGSVVATLAWNTHRHVELYFAVMGLGAVLHTINPRLSPEHLDYIVNHAEGEILFFDTTFAPIVEKMQERFGHVKRFYAMAAEATLDKIAPKIRDLGSYEALIDNTPADPAFTWPQFDERTASSLCYTSGTTGNPKGVLYSHRSTILHACVGGLPDIMNTSANATILVVVPLFHVNAWGLPYSAAMTGTKLVLPGPHMDGKSMYELLRDERVTLAAGVPTVWQMLFQYVDANSLKPREDLCLKTALVGGSAAPRMMIERFDREFDTFLLHAWGMTEMSPLGVVCQLLPKHQHLPAEQRYDVQMKQGRAVWGVQLKIVDEDNQRLPHDGKARGRLLVSGPWIVDSYFKGEGGKILDEEGFFDTGDVAVIDDDGYITLVDRSKDVIKSGGEWISSIDLENVAVGCPGIAMAAVIGVSHPKWQERPLLVCVKKPGAELDKSTVLSYLEGKIAKWWTPDDVVFIDALPLTATGKIYKLGLRQQFKDYQLPTA
ncbi:MAG: long-chain-fatty-acid--CoA ligase [Burkholderiaceae bacterium]|nr:long-chain-fatty-acid--CoA ligase [Burkholderiaceae bacterium]